MTPIHINPYLWQSFWRSVDAKKPRWGMACDTMRIIEGEFDRMQGKLLAFPIKGEEQY